MRLLLLLKLMIIQCLALYICGNGFGMITSILLVQLSTNLRRMGSNGADAIPRVDEAGGSEPTIEIKIKTLDSQTYTLRVDKQVIFVMFVFTLLPSHDLNYFLWMICPKYILRMQLWVLCILNIYLSKDK